MSTNTQDILALSKPLCERYVEIDDLLSYPEIVGDKPYYLSLLKEKNALHKTYELSSVLNKNLAEKLSCEQALFSCDTQEECELISQEIVSLSAIITKTTTLLLGEFTAVSEGSDIILELTADNKLSMEFCQALSDMYVKFCKTAGYNVTVQTQADGKSTKNAILVVDGIGAYALLKNESCRHTELSGGGTASVSIVTYHKQIKEEIDLLNKDIRIDIFNSSGAGGQNVNKVETAVRVTHLATGIVVTCQDERSQLQNKERAMRVLKERLQTLQDTTYLEEITNSKKMQRLAMAKSGTRIYNTQTGLITDARAKTTLPIAAIRSGNIIDLLQSLAVNSQYGN